MMTQDHSAGSVLPLPVLPIKYPMWGDGEQWRSWLRAAGASAGTVRLRAHFVDDFADGHPDAWAVTLDDVVAYLGRPGWAPETRKAARASLRSYYRWAVLTGRMTTDPTLACPVVHVPIGMPRPAPEEVLVAALERADAQTRLMLLLAAYAGLRRAEVAAVHASHVSALGLRVTGKGGRVRVVPIHPRLAAELDGLSGWAFPSLARPGDHVGVDFIARRVTAALGPGWTCHSLRHRFATMAYASGRDLRSVQTLLGHSKPETTARYVAVAQADLVAAVYGVA